MKHNQELTLDEIYTIWDKSFRHYDFGAYVSVTKFRLNIRVI